MTSLQLDTFERIARNVREREAAIHLTAAIMANWKAEHTGGAVPAPPDALAQPQAT